jgi:hypothetical protein
MDLDLNGFVEGVASDGGASLIGMLLRLVYNRSTYAISTADAQRFGAYLRDKEIANESVKPVLAQLNAMVREQREIAALDRDRYDSLIRIIRHTLSPEAQANLELQELLAPGAKRLQHDPSRLMPGELLRAGTEAVPFIGREQELNELFDVWNNEEPVSICLITGQGGGGISQYKICPALKTSTGHGRSFHNSFRASKQVTFVTQSPL